MGKLAAIIVAAGKGSRMRTAESKQYLRLSDKPLLVHTIEKFQNIPEIDSIVLVTGVGDMERCKSYLVRYGLNKVSAVIPGGGQRQDSVYQGLCSLPDDVEWVLVHDGVRPFVKSEQIVRCWREAVRSGAAVLAVPVKDTIKVVSGGGRIQSTPDRRSLWAIQTPQAFRLSLLRQAHEQAAADQFAATDDSMLVERMGIDVQVIEGDDDNFKITTPEDLRRAEWLMGKDGRGRPVIRVGQGYDVHQLVSGRKCLIGGVDIPFERGLLGHSDADVLLHAISDAILGALGLGDIGKHFPDTDAQYQDADSLVLLKRVWELAVDKGYRLGNLDATIIAQRPKMASYIPQMVQIIAGALDADSTQINVKATTSEKLGFVGREEGIAAQAVVCLLQGEQ